MTKPRLRVGSVLEIPLSTGKKIYGRYLHRDPKQGQILQVYNHILEADDDIQLDVLESAGDFFKPIFVGISGAVRSGLWKIIGFIPVKNFSYPGFLGAHWSGNPPVVYRWYFWDGEKYIELGQKLPDKYKKYEYIGGYAPQDVTKRIETGEESFVKKLIAGEVSNKN